MGRSSRTHTRVKVKGWRWRRNTLRRRSDVVETWTRLFLGSALLVGTPLTGSLIGLAAFDNAQAKADHQRATSHVVQATVAENVPLARPPMRAHPGPGSPRPYAGRRPTAAP